MAETAPQVHRISRSEVRNCAVDLQDALNENGSPIEVFTGTPIVLEQNSPNQLTLSNKQVSTGALTINGRSCRAGAAVQFKVNASAATAGSLYTIAVTCGTNAGQTVHGLVQVEVTA